MIPKEEYRKRIENVQKEMKENGIDLVVAYSSECESANSRYLADFWSFKEIDSHRGHPYIPSCRHLSCSIRHKLLLLPLSSLAS
jgi:hypothetical protein